MSAALVIDTCGETGYVGVVRVDVTEAAEPLGTAALAERRLGVRATQEELLPAVEAVLSEAKLRLADLAAIAVVSGPGSFTGVRIGLASAKGLCEVAGVRLVTLSRLAVLANAVEVRPVWALLQAGRGDVYAQAFTSSERGAAEGIATGAEGAAVCSPEAAIAAAGQGAVAVCEEGLRVAMPTAHFIPAEQLEQALRIAAAANVRAQRWSDVALADAMYLRVPDAELLLRASRT